MRRRTDRGSWPSSKLRIFTVSRLKGPRYKKSNNNKLSRVKFMFTFYVIVKISEKWGKQ